ncbi:MAG: cyclic nucleotide-binding domain-containing protein [Polyangiaceae bacterium]|nr:cyclic nucleotide-binding domain-containing protein [Polyangiaceae bacterium]
MTPKEFQKQFKRLLLTPVEGLDWEDKLARVRQYLRQLEARQSPEEESAELQPSVEIIPFEPGRRPVDEALYPGHGCSERVGCLSSNSDEPELADEIWILYRLHDLYAFVSPFDRPFQVTMSAWFVPPPPEVGDPCPVPGLIDVPLGPEVVSTAAYPVPMLEESSWNSFHQTAYVASISPARALMPRASVDGAGGDAEPRASRGYRWEEMPEWFRRRAADGADPFTFANLFCQDLRIELRLSEGGRTISTAQTDVEVFDTGRFGSLYARLMDRLVKADFEAQKRRLGVEELHAGYHPWFPVLTIGTDKAMLYLRAIHQDLEQHRRNLPDPRWLLRVGLYLELLTCLGIFEAVRDEYPDMLSPEERWAFELSPAFAAVRARLDVEAWRKVWALREIVPRASGIFSAGPVSLSNLMRKQKATLAFLHAHHEDLKAAIELGGENKSNAQETWHRVFRDAERAVLKDSALAFPELSHLDPRYREFALWHQCGDMRALGLSILPEALTSLFGDQDGIFPSACRQYRKSMNEVAKWAADRGLMDYTGDECIPKNASLLEAYMESSPARVAALQRRDGYGPALELDEPHPVVQVDSVEEATALLRKVPVFKPLMDREIRKLAQRARRAVYGPLDRIVIQGNRDSSMFVVASGSVEVLVRQPDGKDTPVATLEKGAVLGEFALLTGEERTATVRALGEVVLYEISKEGLQPIIEARPQLVIELSMLMAARQLDLRGASSERSGDEPAKSLAGRIRRFVLG